MKNRRIFGAVILLSVFAVFGGSASAAGKKYGLFVGINKYVTSKPLYGCVNDATNMRATLQSKFGFLPANNTLLTDAAATRDGILNNLKRYQALAEKGDIFVFHYSGHGTLFPDARSEDQDETNLTYLEVMNDKGQVEVWYPRGKYDSAIVPIDARTNTSGKPWRNLILDDELAATFAGFTQKGAQVVFVSDSCHSGTIGRDKRPENPVRTTSLATIFGARRYEDLEIDEPATKRTTGYPVPVGPLYIALTGSKDDEFSLDAQNLPQPMGLFTYNLLKQINPPKGTTLSYGATMAIVSPAVAKEAMKDGNPQNPQIDGRYGDPKTVIFSLPK